MSSTPQASPLLVVLSAPSGAGKTTLCQQLMAQRPSFTRAVTCTTRAPRPGERDGVDYHFLSPKTFETRVAAGDFLEHALVYQNHYGTLKSEVRNRLREGRDVILTVDVQGAKALQDAASTDPELRSALVSVFLTPQTLSELEVRLCRRNQNTAVDLERRLSEARLEIQRWNEFQYLIVSTTIPEDLRRMLAVVDAAKMRSTRCAAPEI